MFTNIIFITAYILHVFSKDDPAAADKKKNDYNVKLQAAARACEELLRVYLPKGEAELAKIKPEDTIVADIARQNSIFPTIITSWLMKPGSEKLIASMPPHLQTIMENLVYTMPSNPEASTNYVFLKPAVFPVINNIENKNKEEEKEKEGEDAEGEGEGEAESGEEGGDKPAGAAGEAAAPAPGPAAGALKLKQKSHEI
ncbi:hypothetical protein EDEG_00744 [Edhazardia aedis USNM 41457]|uniref:Uncharacterized protein n=1 Tax=Edhazardia aedis (strain USNM 41457) TaxID=1003232 RepID=J8ZZU7_EDHAE|nr:hypothetical protein EDEG_00744 [Edhazardia aedis USNM 41457]|eukprot:EJW05163.1 hypothetical protein EDEG_00744 [Edhazardia aedis USNM 41457]